MQPTSLIRRIARWSLLLLAAAPALLPLTAIIVYSVDFPYLDEWDPNIAGLFIRAHNGTLALTDFFAQHNEHRIVIPRIIFFLVGLLTHWNTRVLMIISWMIVCAISGALLVLLVRTSRGRLRYFDARTAVIWFLFNLILFSPMEFENWLWGMGMVNVVPLAFLILALMVVGTDWRLPMRVALAVLFCTAATFSCGSGMLSWPVIGLMLAWSGTFAELRKKAMPLIGFLVGGIACVALYYVHYIPPTSPSGSQDHFAGLLPALRFAVAFQGTPFAYTMPFEPGFVATFVGVIELAVLAIAFAYFCWLWLIKKRPESCEPLLPWFALPAFSIACGLAAAVFRADQGIGLAISSRYIAFSCFMPLGLVALVSMICLDIRERVALQSGDLSAIPDWTLQLPAATGMTLVIFCALGMPSGFRGSYGARVDHIGWKSAVLLIRWLPDDNPLRSYAGKTYEATRNEAIQLSDLGYLRPPLIATGNAANFESHDADATPRGKMEQISQNGAIMVISGWAIDPRLNEIAHCIFLTYQNERDEEVILNVAVRGSERADIAQQKGNLNYHFCGWVAQIPVTQIPSMYQRVRLTAWSFDSETGKAYRLDGARLLSR